MFGKLVQKIQKWASPEESLAMENGFGENR